MSTQAPRAETFDALYRHHRDPWGYETSDYERSKCERTLTALPRPHVRHGLEMGCSIGVFTELLAPACDSLVAVDFSAVAVRAARERLGAAGHVEILCGDLRAGLPEGRFDLIVCSEVLYYWPPTDVQAWLARVRRALEPGGALVAVHWTGNDPEAPMTGPQVHRLLATEAGGLDHTLAERHEGFLLDRFEAPL